jgi:hypothetical protein
MRLRRGGRERRGHVVNIVEFEEVFCLVEPQAPNDRNQLCCWDKANRDIRDVPARCMRTACRDQGCADTEDCVIDDAWCDLRPSTGAGEISFLHRPKVCDALTSCGFDARAHAPDRDQDGVPDDIDRCPDLAREVARAGQADRADCPYSSDCGCPRSRPRHSVAGRPRR